MVSNLILNSTTQPGDQTIGQQLKTVLFYIEIIGDSYESPDKAAYLLDKLRKYITTITSENFRDEGEYFEFISMIDFLNKLSVKDLLTVYDISNSLKEFAHDHDIDNDNELTYVKGNITRMWHNILIVWITKYLKGEISEETFWREIFTMSDDGITGQFFTDILEYFGATFVDPANENGLYNIPKFLSVQTTNKNFWMTFFIDQLLDELHRITYFENNLDYDINQTIVGESISPNPEIFIKFLDSMDFKNNGRFYFSSDPTVIKKWLTLAIEFFYHQGFDEYYAKKTLSDLINDVELLLSLQKRFKGHDSELNKKIIQALKMII